MSKILNLDARDYHMHSSTFSDGTSTIDEIARFAWEIWLTEIAITDHSDATYELLIREWITLWRNSRKLFKSRWKNVFNNVNVIFWVEADLLDAKWNICQTIQWFESDFMILSAHEDVYQWKKESITDAYLKAIEKYGSKIKCIWHPDNTRYYGNEIDMHAFIDACNAHNIALEINAKTIISNHFHPEKLRLIIQKAHHIYLNSDAHSLYELQHSRKQAKDFLKNNGYLF